MSNRKAQKPEDNKKSNPVVSRRNERIAEENKARKQTLLKVLGIIVIVIVGIMAFRAWDNGRGPYLEYDAGVCEELEGIICQTLTQSVLRSEIHESLWSKTKVLVKFEKEAIEDEQAIAVTVNEGGISTVTYYNTNIETADFYDTEWQDIGRHESFHTSIIGYDVVETNIQLLNPIEGYIKPTKSFGLSFRLPSKVNDSGVWSYGHLEEGAATLYSVGPEGYQDEKMYFQALVNAAEWSEERFWQERHNPQIALILCEEAYQGLFSESCDLAVIESMLWAVPAKWLTGEIQPNDLTKWKQVSDALRTTKYNGQVIEPILVTEPAE